VASGRIVTPIRRLQQAASLIGKGALEEPIAVQTGDELEQLAGRHAALWCTDPPVVLGTDPA